MLEHNFDLSEIRALDLFAGTGNITFEFASRGARSVIAVDQHFGCIRYIRETAEKLGIDTIKAVKYDAFKFIAGTTDRFHCIFADPPYDLKEAPEVPQSIHAAGLLLPGGWLIFEHSEEKDYSHLPLFLQKRTYGKVGFSIFQKEN
jgi:16S rRNA (guanine966-N2)-methyltransferase